MPDITIHITYTRGEQKTQPNIMGATVGCPVEVSLSKTLNLGSYTNNCMHK